MKISYISFIFIIATISFCGLSIPANSQTDSCNLTLNLKALPFNTTTLQCVTAWAPQNIILRYVQSSPNLWSFVLSAPEANNYIGVGFSSNGLMVGSSAVVGWISATDGSSGVKQYHLLGRTPTQVVPEEGNLQIASSTITAQSSRLFLAFQLNTSSPPSSRVLYAIGRLGALPSSPSYSLTEHRDKVSTTLNYVTGQATEEGQQYTKLRRSHGILNMLGWGILIVIGAFVARYCRQWDPVWFYAHACIQSLGFLLGVAGVICGLVLEDRLGADVSTHKGLGVFILVLGCLQVMAILARPDKSSKVRIYWNWYHYGVGRTLMAFAIANVFYGIHLGEKGNGWNAGYGVVIAILFATAVVLEVRMWMRKLSH